MSLPASLASKRAIGNGGGGRVAVPVEVDPDPVDRQIEPPGGGVDDARVRLVGDEHIDVVERQSGLLDRLGGGIAHHPHRELEDLVPFICR